LTDIRIELLTDIRKGLLTDIRIEVSTKTTYKGMIIAEGITTISNVEMTEEIEIGNKLSCQY